MSSKKNKQTAWQLTRERFQIATHRPPKPFRAERGIGDILSDIQQETAAQPKIPPALIERWPLIVGQQIAKHTYPAVLRGGLLYVYADHTGWLSEVRRVPKNHLLKKISSIQGIQPIKQIRFQLDPDIRSFFGDKRSS